jgi:hypothetical protein
MKPAVLMVTCPHFPVHNVKAVVLHVRFLLNQLADVPLLRPANFPHRSHGRRDQALTRAVDLGSLFAPKRHVSCVCPPDFAVAECRVP